ncbi:MAG: hypothetical protein IT239_02320 [Bacteroidia bacterium]|nr:hypothetical protein [Bacteroidia bacterium]
MVNFQKLIIYCCSLLVSFSIYAQSESSFIRSGLLKATSTITPSFMLNRKINNIYVSGELEYFLEDKISVRGDGLWYRDSQQKTPFLKQNSMVFFGALYHFSNKKNDLFFGVQPAVILAQPNLTDTLGGYYPAVINPGMSLIAGYTFYVWDYCNFYVNARYLQSKYVGTRMGKIPLDELFISAGLGFQIHTRKGK